MKMKPTIMVALFLVFDCIFASEYGPFSEAISFDRKQYICVLSKINPTNFETLWNAKDTQDFLIYISRIDNPNNEDNALKEAAREWLTFHITRFNERLITTKEHLENPALRLIPYFLGLTVIPPLMSWYFGDTSISLPLYVGCANTIIRSLYKNYFNDLSCELEKLKKQKQLMTEAFKKTTG